MGSIIIALPKIEDAKNISGILKRRGLDTDYICTSSAQVLSNVNQLDNGIVICGVSMPDMHYTQLAEYLPDNFEMLLMATPRVIENCPPGIVSLTYPIKSSDLIGTVEMILEQQARKRKKLKSMPKKRTIQEQNYINNAKYVLMERNNMTEQEAFRYIQKCSMDSGTNMVETAQMILTMMCLE